MIMHNVLAAVLITVALTSPPQQGEAPKATRLERLLVGRGGKTAPARHRGSDTARGGAEEHGPHLRLRNDLTLAEYFTGRVEAPYRSSSPRHSRTISTRRFSSIRAQRL